MWPDSGQVIARQARRSERRVVLLIGFPPLAHPHGYCTIVFDKGIIIYRSRNQEGVYFAPRLGPV